MSVYFIQAGHGGRIKIGYSPDPDMRIDFIRRLCGPDLIVLAVIEGSVGVERKLHELLQDHCAHHEWFEPTLEVLDVVRRAKLLYQAGVRDAAKRQFTSEDLRGLINRGGMIGDAAATAFREDIPYRYKVLAVLLRLFPENSGA
jgi:hypothetical protein